jgi:hypothetical protein
MTLPESFRLTGPLSGYLTFLTKRVHGVSRTIIHRGDRSYSASGLVHIPSPPISCSSYTHIISCVILYIPTLTRRFSAGVGSPLFPRHPIYIQFIYGCLPPTPLSSKYKPFPYSLRPLPLYCLLWHNVAPYWMSLVTEYTCPLKTPFGDPHDYICRWLCGCNT